MSDSTTEVPTEAVPTERPGVPGGKRDRNRRARVAALASCALELFLEQGIEGTSIDDITKKAGTAKGSFYRYFSGKEALVEALIAPISGGFASAFSRCDEALTLARSRGEMTAAYTEVGANLSITILGHPDLVRLYLQENRGAARGARAPIVALADRIRDSAIAITATAHAHGLLRAFPAEISALVVIGASERLVLATLNGRIAHPERLPEQVTQLVLEGLAGEG